MKKNVAILFIILTAFLFNCREETDVAPPLIEIHSPESGEQYHLQDTIKVNASITATEPIKSVKVVLTTMEFTTALPATYLYPNTGSYSLSIDYTINDNSLSTNDYYLLIRADLENNFKNQYQKIHIVNNTTPNSRLIILTAPSSNAINIYETDESTNEVFLFTITGDYSASEVSAANNLLFIAGRSAINIHAYDLLSFNLNWKQDVIPYLPMHNNNCLFFDEYLYASFNFQYILGYNASGAIVFDTPINEPDAPGRIYKHGDFVLVDMQKKNISSSSINSYFAGTGALKQEILTTFKVLEFFSLDNDLVLIIGNKNGLGAIYEYNVGQNFMSLRKEIAEQIFCAEKISGQEYILATNSEVLQYRYTQNSLSDLISTTGVTRIKYDSYFSMLSLVTGKVLDVYQYPEMVNQKTITFSDTILNIHPVVTNLRK